jgi:hypothetical protein
MRFGSPPNEGAWQPMRSSRPPSSDGTVIVASGVLAVFLGNRHVAVWPKSSRHLTDENLPVLRGAAVLADGCDGERGARRRNRRTPRPEEPKCKSCVNLFP